MSRATPRFRRTNPHLPLVGSGNGVVVYKVIGSIEGQLTISTFMYSSQIPAPTNAQLQTLLGNISANIFNAYKACVSADWVCTGETVDVVHRNDIQGVSSVANAGVVGTRAAGHEPTEIAAVIIRSSAVKGQHGRGRLSLPAVATVDVTASRITGAGMLAALLALINAMLLVATDGVNNYTPSIGERAPTPPKLIVGFSPLVRLRSTTLLGTIRRRKIGRGK